MGIMDIFNAGKIKKENEGLKELLTPEMQDAAALNAHIIELEAQKEKLEKTANKLSASIEAMKKEAIFFEDAITCRRRSAVGRSGGLYSPLRASLCRFIQNCSGSDKDKPKGNDKKRYRYIWI